MLIPSRYDLPFVAYGLFRPGQLGYHRISAFVARQEPVEFPGELRMRDGLPVLDLAGDGTVSGVLLHFLTPSDAYARIVEIEPDKQYRWTEITIGGQDANVLAGVSPRKGSEPLEENWDGASDPLFTHALEVVRETIAQNSKFEWDLKPMFRLEMAYLLLWSSIERFLSLKYHLGDDVWAKVKRLGDEPAFVEALRTLNPAERAVFRADDPQRRVNLRPDPAKAVEHYYQIRSNITHRGKGVVKDHERVLTALGELIALFEKVLEANFPARRRGAQLAVPFRQ